MIACARTHIHYVLVILLARWQPRIRNLVGLFRPQIYNENLYSIRHIHGGTARGGSNCHVHAVESQAHVRSNCDRAEKQCRAGCHFWHSQFVQFALE
jgi:hypothetical protein